MPPNINTKELIVSAPSLRFIPNTLNVDSLSIINTNIEKLPPLKLNYLNAKGSKIKDLRNIQVNEFLDLSSTPIQFLSKTLNVSFLILKNCQNLKQLPENLTIQGLDISNTSLSNIPNIHYQWLLMNNHKNLETLPDGISFNVLEAQNSVLKTIPNNICANRVNISKTAVSHLPNNLNINELNISKTDIHTLPNTLIVQELTAKKNKDFIHTK